MKKIAIVEIKGGLGNQIFQYIFSKYLEDQNFKIYYNLTFFKKGSELNLNNTEREFVLDRFINSLPIAGKFLILTSTLLNFLVNSKKVAKLFPFLEQKTFTYFKEKDLGNKNFNYINYFEGYWQNPVYLDVNISELNHALKKFDHKEQLIKNNLVLVHVRRGDFIELKIDLPINYYENSFLEMKKSLGNFEFDIFTDDKKWVEKQGLFSDYNNIYSDDDVVDTFIKMRNYKNYIIANSTFSYLAAYLRRDKSGLVIVPKKWSENNNLITQKNINWKQMEF